MYYIGSTLHPKRSSMATKAELRNELSKVVSQISSLEKEVQGYNDRIGRIDRILRDNKEGGKRLTSQRRNELDNEKNNLASKASTKATELAERRRRRDEIKPLLR
ncbi:hypothetical protein TM7_0195 [candidate division TM7 genomosp. GTL1]|nr:hypothetical protein TM7_0195 [candidate division TM7 genomosp. GTL1]